MPRDFVREFAARVRQRAADPIIGASAEARVMTQLAEQLEREYEAFLDEKVSSGQAANESGYSRQQIALLRRTGIISQRRGDLPRKPGFGVTVPTASTQKGPTDLADEVIAARRRGLMKRVG
jgi:hypothetical protein